MRSFVYFEVFWSGEHLAAAGEGTGERLLSSVHADVIHQFVFRFERPPIPRAALPEARVRRALGPAHVLHCQMRHYLMHTWEQFVAHFSWGWLFRIKPLTPHVSPWRSTHVAQEGMGGVWMRVWHEWRSGALVVYGVATPIPALLQRLLREQLPAATIVTQVAGLIGVQRVGLVVRRVVWRMRAVRGVRGGGAVLRARPARRLRRHLQAVGRQVRVVGLQEGVHGGGGRRRRIAPLARHHPRGGVFPADDGSGNSVVSDA